MPHALGAGPLHPRSPVRRALQEMPSRGLAACGLQSAAQTLIRTSPSCLLLLVSVYIGPRLGWYLGQRQAGDYIPRRLR